MYTLISRIRLLADTIHTQRACICRILLSTYGNPKHTLSWCQQVSVRGREGGRETRGGRGRGGEKGGGRVGTAIERDTHIKKERERARARSEGTREEGVWRE